MYATKATITFSLNGDLYTKIIEIDAEPNQLKFVNKLKIAEKPETVPNLVPWPQLQFPE